MRMKRNTRNIYKHIYIHTEEENACVRAKELPFPRTRFSCCNPSFYKSIIDNIIQKRRTTRILSNIILQRFTNRVRLALAFVCLLTDKVPGLRKQLMMVAWEKKNSTWIRSADPAEKRVALVQN